jgi:hypothetical protein
MRLRRHSPPLLERFAMHFLPVRPTDSTRSFFDLRTLIKIDLVVEGAGLSAGDLLSRASPIALTEDSVILPILSAEDVVLTRLVWYHETGEIGAINGTI